MYCSGESVLASGSFARVAQVSHIALRSGLNCNHPTVMQVPKGGIVRVQSGPQKGGWYRLSYRGIAGYAPADWLAPTPLAGRAIAHTRRDLIVVSVALQQLEAYQHGKLILIGAVTTGRPVLPTMDGVS
jgi:uncharacterized protein YraI